MDAETPSPYIEVETTEHGDILVPFRKEFIADINREKKTVTIIGSVEQHVLPK